MSPGTHILIPEWKY